MSIQGLSWSMGEGGARTHTHIFSLSHTHTHMRYKDQAAWYAAITGLHQM